MRSKWWSVGVQKNQVGLQIVAVVISPVNIQFNYQMVFKWKMGDREVHNLLASWGVEEGYLQNFESIKPQN